MLSKNRTTKMETPSRGAFSSILSHIFLLHSILLLLLFQQRFAIAEYQSEARVEFTWGEAAAEDEAQKSQIKMTRTYSWKSAFGSKEIAVLKNLTIDEGFQGLTFQQPVSRKLLNENCEITTCPDCLGTKLAHKQGRFCKSAFLISDHV
jgi:hypothetical protein